MPDPITPTSIFIVGYMHSGTSLLQNIISKAEGVFSPPGEVKFIEYLPTLRERYPLGQSPEEDAAFRRFCLTAIVGGVPFTRTSKEKDRPVPEAYAGVLKEEIPGDHLAVFFRQLDRIATIDGCSHWLEKSPNNLFYADTIRRYRPEARFIVIVRDGRDVLASKKKRQQTVTEERYRPDQIAWKKLEKKYSPLIDNLSWAASAGEGLKLLNRYPEQAMLVRYEDLVDDPEQEVRRVCAFLGLPFDARMIDVRFSNPADYQNKKQGIYRNYGKFEKELNPVEIAFTELLVGKTLRSLGYNMDRHSPPWGVRFQGLLLFPRGLWQLLDRLAARYRLLGPGYFRAFVKTNLIKLLSAFKK